LGQELWVAISRAALGLAITAQGRFQQGISLLRQSVRVLEDFGGEEQEHWWRIWLADCLAEQGNYQAARREAEKAHRFYRGSGRPWGTAQALLVMARASLGTGDHPESRQRLEKASARLRGVGNRETLALTLIYQAYPALGLGDLGTAEKVLAEGLAMACQIGWHNALVSGVPALALLRARQGRPEGAVELYAIALSDPKVRASRWYDDLVGSEIATAAATLPPGVAAAARARGQKRDLKAAVGEFVGEQAD
jgi:tetratricopeptide (TPR) repeat protein